MNTLGKMAEVMSDYGRMTKSRVKGFTNGQMDQVMMVFGWTI